MEAQGYHLGPNVPCRDCAIYILCYNGGRRGSLAFLGNVRVMRVCILKHVACVRQPLGLRSFLMHCRLRGRKKYSWVGPFLFLLYSASPHAIWCLFY